MTAYDPTNSSAPADQKPATPTGEATENERPETGAVGSAPQIEPTFWHDEKPGEQTSHVEAPLYRGDAPVIAPAGGHSPSSPTSSAPLHAPTEPYRTDPYRTDPYRTDPHSTDPYGSSTYSADSSGPGPFGPSSSGPSSYGTSSYGTDSPGAGSYGARPYGTAAYPAAPVGAPQPFVAAPLPSASATDNPGKPKRMRSAIVGTAVAAALIGGAAGAGTVAVENRSSATTASSVLSNTSSTAPTSAITNGTVSAAAAKITPSVVTIQVVGSNESGTGSGVIVRSDGYILTNNHVVSVAGTGGSITVQTSDGRSAKATIIGTDSTDDLAVIKVTGLAGLTAATFAKSSALTVGQTVVAVGAPLGLSDTVTSGIVSATARTVRSGDNDAAVFAAVQTDAAINPGNSGGALVDLNGNVIGINAAIASTGSSGVTVPGQQETQSGNIGIGFAIPSDEASRIANELIATGKATHAVLGVQVASSTSTTSTGATLRAVTAGGAAAAAGLKAGDVVTRVDSARMSDGDDLIAAIRAHAVKDTVTITYTRAGAVHTAKVTLTSATS